MVLLALEKTILYSIRGTQMPSPRTTMFATVITLATVYVLRLPVALLCVGFRLFLLASMIILIRSKGVG
eukprot:scaffold1304_cov82-Cylindrotheca_fusiformis.AAC.7